MGGLLDGCLEDVMEDERQALVWREGMEYHKERNANRVGQ
jgi:hypothetical protein